MPQRPSIEQQECGHASSSSPDSHPRHRRRKRTGCRGIRAGGRPGREYLGNRSRQRAACRDVQAASGKYYLHALKKEKRYFATWKDFDAHDAKTIAEAGINVLNPDDAGPKHGEVRIAFGDPAKKPTVYSVNPGPLTMTMTRKGAEIMFRGKTKDGIDLRVTAKCSDVDQF